ncbi:hypothetical protein, partial [Bacteroides xylanisolvens]|uniref:hypothetical protein n=1 Tax=Bacteroides xylanisolvens TaxID=371601 RepID=UPI001C37C247
KQSFSLDFLERGTFTEYPSLIGDIHYGSPNSHIYFTYIQPLFHYGKRLVSHRETNRFAI